jgi:hypothetical protein
LINKIKTILKLLLLLLVLGVFTLAKAQNPKNKIDSFKSPRDTIRNDSILHTKKKTKKTEPIKALIE